MQCDVLRAGFRTLLGEMQIEPIVAAQADSLRLKLRLHTSVDLLIADVYQLSEALEIASEYQLPLLVIAPTLAQGLAIAHDEAFRGVMALPLTTRALLNALRAVVRGERFLPLDVFLPLADARLSIREQELIALDLHDVPTEDIARWMEVALFTLYTYRNRLRKKLRQIDPTALPEWAAEWLRRFPGRRATR